MQRMMGGLLAGLVFFAAQAAPASAAEIVQSDDVALFFRVYDAARGSPSAEVLQRDYLDRGTAGLARFAQLRRITGETIAAALGRDRGLYERARQCAAALPAATRRVEQAVERLRALLPGAEIPAVTVAIGRGRPVAVGERGGAYIGLEALCAWDAPDPDVEDRIVRVIVHELVHTQQTGLAERPEDASVLHAALVEGAAEFVTELLTGAVAYGHLAAATAGRERGTEEAFLRDIDRPAVGSNWVYNGSAAADGPGDLGYWAGYRVVKAYYQQAHDKRAALAAILGANDAHAFLAASGWQPGMVLR